MPHTPPTVLWQVYPLGATGAPIRDWSDPGTDQHRLARLEPWLDHVATLADTILLGPVFASQTHGYDTLDHFRIDPRLGDEEDFDRLVAEAGARGLGIVIDGVFNHVARGHELADFVRRDDSGTPAVFEGHGALLELDHDAPEVADYVVRAMCHWLERGAVGWRLDAAYAISPDFWARVVPRVRERFPNAWLLGEVIHGDYPAFVGQDRLDSVTQYELWKAIWSSLKDGNFFELDWALQRHREFLDSFVPTTFVGNHDVERIASTLPLPRAGVAALLLATLPGIPSVYAGDEWGQTGVKGEGFAADDPLRPALPESPADLDLTPAQENLLGTYRWLYHLRSTESPADLETLELTNLRYVYRAGALTVDIDLEGPAATVTRDGQTIWSLPDFGD